MHLLLIAAAIVAIAPVQQSQPNRQPQLAAVPGLTALVFGSQNTIYFSASHDDGKSFSQPLKIATLPLLMLGRHRGPRVVIAGKTIVVSAVYGSTNPPVPVYNPLTLKRPFYGDLAVWRSTDSGKTWSQPVAVNDMFYAAREGLHAMAASPDGEIAAVWLDDREQTKMLYGSYSRDGGATWSKNTLLYKSPDGTICQCCDPSIIATGDRHFEVMFRNFLGGNRDMYVVNWSTDGAIAKPEKAGTGSWRLDACPMDGGGIVRVGSKTVTAWRREHTVYLDEMNEPEVALGDGKDVAIAGSPKGAYVAWTGAAGIQIHKPGAGKPICLSPVGNFPAVTALPNGHVLAAWENGGVIDTQVLE